ncbi:NUDIX domain-containing protein [Cohnella ginsengisoli]|uniref:NUDIX domain-containing protein n=1 Tax=Cohnella ginsengisoli TaxID=425004 RepID=A0A9X4QNT3_9BACL|nr:NUDIX domain-containing protein [Cohnella ginsengisoli]MDG0792757.1 NUDIX domain-containing protein [Cohnella ginsengisoli]
MSGEEQASDGEKQASDGEETGSKEQVSCDEEMGSKEEVSGGGEMGNSAKHKPEERFDIYDELDRPIGTATRSEAHARGLWHHTFHCWLARRGEDGRARILFQRRSRDKDTNPDRFDITAAGHLSAGETVRDAVRELQEELGLRVSLEDLAPLGTFREQDEGFAQGVRYIDREVSEVYGYVTDRGPETFRLQREELAGLGLLLMEGSSSS